ncbi:hypothetical protein [Streptomyces sp.]|uniref:hypothetical protein n=1 Tax=Streptomyces sp. TaxID=1931 RepID=UPI002F42BE47
MDQSEAYEVQVVMLGSHMGWSKGVRAAVAATAHDLSYEVALSHPVRYIIGAMDSGRYSIEIEPEVRM